MNTVKNIIIGFGKAGKTLAQDLGNRGESTILIEKDPQMYGGACIAVACIPSKKLATLASKKRDTDDPAIYYKESIQEKKHLINQLTQANYEKVQGTENVEVIDGEASFESETVVKISKNDGSEEFYEAERIFINTGSTPNIPPIKGIKIDSKRVHTSKTIMDDEEFPERLIIIGDGPISLEFASIYSQFGSKVTVLSRKDSSEFVNQLAEEDSMFLLGALQNMGIDFIFNADVTEIDTSQTNELGLHYEVEDTMHEIKTDKVLVATGRRPNVEQLNLDDAGVILAENGSIQINKRLQTNKEHIYALGDVNGGAQQTFLSLDDYRIVRSQLYGDGSYDLSKRAFIPMTIFTNPPLSTIGLSEEAAKESGFNTKVAKISVESIPKSKILDKTVGFYKVIVDAETNQILGAVLFGEESHEVINIIATAMIGRLPYQILRDQVYTHPTMAEALNNLFSEIK